MSDTVQQMVTRNPVIKKAEYVAQNFKSYMDFFFKTVLLPVSVNKNYILVRYEISNHTGYLSNHTGYPIPDIQPYRIYNNTGYPTIPDIQPYRISYHTGYPTIPDIQLKDLPDTGYVYNIYYLSF